MCHDGKDLTHLHELHYCSYTPLTEHCCSTDMGGLYSPSIDNMGRFYIRGFPWMVSPSVNGVHPTYFMLIGGRVLKNWGKGLILIFNSCLHPLAEFITGVYVVS